MEGPANAFSVDEENLGMRLAIREVNDSGGVHGRLIVDRAYPRGSEDPVAQASRNARRLVEEDDVFLLLNFGGPAAVQIGAYAMRNDIPYLFPHTALLTVDGDRHVFTSYPRYAGESRMMLRIPGRGPARRTDCRYSRAEHLWRVFSGTAPRLSQNRIGYEFVGARSLPLLGADALDEMRMLRECRSRRLNHGALSGRGPPRRRSKSRARLGRHAGLFGSVDR